MVSQQLMFSMTDVNVILCTSLDVIGRCYCQGCDGYNAFVTDVIVTFMQWLMETTLFRDNNQLIVTDGKSHICG